MSRQQVTTLDILDSTIATVDLADQSVTNTKLALDVARTNYIVNGGFEVWQRGTIATTNGAYGPDRWVLAINGTSTLQVSREANAVNLDTGSQFACSIVYTHNAASFLTQRIEGGPQLAGRTLTVSMRVRANAANAVRVDLVGTVTARVVGSYHSGNNVYQTLTTTITLASNETTLDVQVVLNASCNAWLDNAMLVLGSVPASYVPLHPADELERCQRYYQKHGAVTAAFASNGYALAGAYYGFWVMLPVQMGGTPIVTKVGTWTTVNCAQPTVGTAITPSGFQLYTTATAAGSVNFYCTDANSYVTAEWNP